MSSLDFYTFTEDTKETQSVPCAWVYRPVCASCHKMLSLKAAGNVGAIYCMGKGKDGQICGTVNRVEAE